MDNLNELKKGILAFEKEAHRLEERAKEDLPDWYKKRFEFFAGRYRMIAACMWEKLERLEAEEAENRKETEQ